METEYKVSASTEVKTREEAEALIRELAKLGLDPRLSEIHTPTPLLPIEPGRLAELGSLNYRGFVELMQAVGKDEPRAWSMWGILLRNTKLVREHAEPQYEVDEDAIRAVAQSKNRASRQRIESQIMMERRFSTTTLDLAPVVMAIQDGSLFEALNIGPIGFDDLTMVANVRIRELLEQDTSQD